MEIKNYIILFCLSILFSQMYSQEKYDFIDITQLDELKSEFEKKNASNLIKELEAKANLALLNGDYSVTYGKSKSSEGLNPNDFQSTSVYYWTDENSGKLRKKDGRRNPDGAAAKLEDSKSLVNLMADLKILSVAYYITRNEQYAKKAVDLMKTWFINSKTRMNPNMNYAQMKPNEKKGNPSGIIETRRFIYIPDIISLISTSSSYTHEFEQGITNWFSDYFNWMKTSDLGMKLNTYENNQKSYYFLQLLVFSKFSFKNNSVKWNIGKEFVNIIDKQIGSKGQLIYEVKRAKAFNYCVFILKSYSLISMFANNNGSKDLLFKKNKNAVSVFNSFKWLRKYINGEKKWPYNGTIDIDSAVQYYYLINFITLEYSKDESNQISITDTKILQQIDTTFSQKGKAVTFLEQMFLI